MWATTGSQWSSQSRGGSQWRIRLENKAGCSRLVMEAGVDRAGDDQHLDLELCGILYEERLDPVDSPLSRIAPRLLAVDDGVTVTSSTVLDRSM